MHAFEVVLLSFISCCLWGVTLIGLLGRRGQRRRTPKSMLWLQYRHVRRAGYTYALIATALCWVIVVATSRKYLEPASVIDGAIAAVNLWNLVDDRKDDDWPGQLKRLRRKVSTLINARNTQPT